MNPTVHVSIFLFSSVGEYEPTSSARKKLKDIAIVMYNRCFLVILNPTILIDRCCTVRKMVLVVSVTHGILGFI